MSKRNIRDWMSRAFFAKDKATFARIADEAEQEAITLAKGKPMGNGNGNGETMDPGEDTGHVEPDGDEGKHPQNVHIHVEHQGEGGGRSNGDSLTDRVAKLEDGVAGINDKLGRVLDALPPEFLKKKDDGDEPTGDNDGEREKTEDADWGGDVTEGGTDKDGKGKDGGLTMKAPPSSSAELVEADPALAQEKTRMGDAAVKARTIQAMGTVMRDTVARAEIMAPGIKVGTLDAGGVDKWAATQQRLHALRKAALKKLMANEDDKAVLGPYAATADNMSYDATRLIFNDAAEKIRTRNNAANVPSPMFGDAAGGIRAYRTKQEAIIGSINDANRAHWEKQGVAMGEKRRRAA
jgi:hypothetical protein